MKELITQAAEQHRLPQAVSQDNESTCESTDTIPVLAVAVKIIPEIKLLSADEVQSFLLAVEVKGVSHNKRPLAEQGIDVVFLIDNS